MNKLCVILGLCALGMIAVIVFPVAAVVISLVLLFVIPIWIITADWSVTVGDVSISVTKK